MPLCPREATEDKDQLIKQETVRVVSPLSGGRDGSPEDCGKEGKWRVKGRGRRDSDTLLRNEVPGGQRVRGINKQRRGFLGARVEFGEIIV